MTSSWKQEAQSAPAEPNALTQLENVVDAATHSLVDTTLAIVAACIWLLVFTPYLLAAAALWLLRRLVRQRRQSL